MNKGRFVVILIFLSLLVVVAIFLLRSQDEATTALPSEHQVNEANTQVSNEPTSVREAETDTEQSPALLPPTPPYKVAEKAILHTTAGNIAVEFFPDEAPKTVANFVQLAEAGFYNGTLFHRVIKDFMIQGGDPLSKDDDPSNDGTGGPGYRFEDEINQHKLVKGALAMANAGPDTNGSQFFIVTAEETPWLDGKHTVFGQVVDGMEIVSSIAETQTDDRDRPLEAIIINSIELEGVYTL